MKRILSLILSLVLLSLFWVNLNNRPHIENHYFRDPLTNRENESINEKDVSRWVNNYAYVYLENIKDPVDYIYFNEAIKKINSLTNSFTFVRVKDKEKANITVKTIKEETDWYGLASTETYQHKNGNVYLDKAVVTLNTLKTPDMIKESVLIHEFLHALGLHHNKLGDNSIMSTNGRIENRPVTDYDARAVIELYDEKSGNIGREYKEKENKWKELVKDDINLFEKIIRIYFQFHF